MGNLCNIYIELTLFHNECMYLDCKAIKDRRKTYDHISLLKGQSDQFCFFLFVLLQTLFGTICLFGTKSMTNLECGIRVFIWILAIYRPFIERKLRLSTYYIDQPEDNGQGFLPTP